MGSMQTIVLRPLTVIYSTLPLIDFASNLAALAKVLAFLPFLFLVLFSFEAKLFFYSMLNSLDAEKSSHSPLFDYSACVNILEIKKFCTSGITCVYFKDSSYLYKSANFLDL